MLIISNIIVYGIAIIMDTIVAYKLFKMIIDDIRNK